MALTTVENGDRYIAETILNQLQALTAEIPGVRQAEDPEFLHRMRVASRRLRNMLALFADQLPSKSLPGWQKQARRITRVLGAARDLDVLILFVREFAQAQDDSRARYGLSRLLLRLQQERDRRQHRLLSILDDLERGHMIGALEHHLRQLRVQAQLHPDKGGVTALYVRAESVITTHLAEMMSFEIYLDAPPNADNQYEMLHAMRIAAKHLRYSMTVFAPLFEDGLREPIKAARTIQDLLGSLHDCDVWITTLPQFLVEERQRILEYTGYVRGIGRITAGIDLLLQDRIATRTQILQEFRSTWRRMQEKNIWPTLLTTLRDAAAPAVDDAPTEMSE